MKALFVIDRQLALSVQPAFEEEGITIDVAEQATDADLKVRTQCYDAVVLDHERLGGLGRGRLRRWRRGGLTAYFLVLLPSECDSMTEAPPLVTGADGYLLRAFWAEELLARLRMLMRRSQLTMNPIRRVHDLEINFVTRTARRGGRTIPLTEREFDLLQFLALRPGRVTTRAAIQEHLYNGKKAIRSNVVDVYIGYLRRKIDKGCPKPLILTRRGRGYLLRDPNG